MTTCTYRLNALEKETTLTLDETTLRVEREGRLEQRPLSHITAVRLSCNPSRVDLGRYDCRLETRDGARLTVCSTTYLGFGKFGSQAPAYGTFVRELHDRLAPLGGIRFARGDPPLRFYGSLGCFIASLLLVFAAPLATGLLFMPRVAAAKLLVMIFFIPWIIRYAKLNRPRSYEPSLIPDTMLP
ncbi:hypothetical protein KKG45_07530 [bacterium]|nr:hypothetical protein [bacterium]MBU1073081.1 hypothetical protein [bacterium]MBU1674711.1 hypothetical protein [bacterium]